MTAFGDFEEGDALDTAPADPEQVARKLHRLRIDHGLEQIEWETIPLTELIVLVGIIDELMAWLRRQGAA